MDVRRAIKTQFFHGGLEMSAHVEELLGNWLAASEKDRAGICGRV
jgi:hypothetical protein